MSVRRQIELSNDVAAALSGPHDAVLRQLEEHVDCQLFLRGNLVTLEGDAEAVSEGKGSFVLIFIGYLPARPREVSRRTPRLRKRTRATRTSAPAQAWRCQSS